MREIDALVDSMRIDEKGPGGPGHPPASRRDLLKSFLFLEKARVPVLETKGWLTEFKDAPGLGHVYAVRPLYNPSLTLERRATSPLDPSLPSASCPPGASGPGATHRPVSSCR